jgi:membrane protease YdiL (CAAX protease family)
LMGVAITYKIAEMAVGSKTFPQVPDTGPEYGPQLVSGVYPARRQWATWSEVALIFGLLEAVMWTPRSFAHTLLIVSLVGSALWLGLRGRTGEELGLAWPSRKGMAWILGTGCLLAIAIPGFVRLVGQPVPANVDWPRFQNLWPYVIWAFAQQFLLQSFLYVRLESLLGSRVAVLATILLFTVAHLPNLPLTALTFAGAVFFTEMFRRYRSIYALGIAHAMLGIAVAYSFPDRWMHHMRVGLSFWQFR